MKPLRQRIDTVIEMAPPGGVLVETLREAAGRIDALEYLARSIEEDPVTRPEVRRMIQRALGMPLTPLAG